MWVQRLKPYSSKLMYMKNGHVCVILIRNDRIFYPPSCQNLYYQEGKQKINLEWPKHYTYVVLFLDRFSHFDLWYQKRVWCISIARVHNISREGESLTAYTLYKCTASSNTSTLSNLHVIMDDRTVNR